MARSTIYLIFGSRAGLFDAFTEDLADRTGLAGLTEAVANPDARRHLREGIAAAYRMYAEDVVVYRVLFSMNHLDPASLGGAVERMEKSRAEGMAYLAQRLAEDSVLRDDVTVDQAEDVLWVLCSFETFDALYTARGRSLDETIEVIIRTAEHALCRPAHNFFITAAQDRSQREHSHRGRSYRCRRNPSSVIAEQRLRQN